MNEIIRTLQRRKQWQNLSNILGQSEHMVRLSYDSGYASEWNKNNAKSGMASEDPPIKITINRVVSPRSCNAIEKPKKEKRISRGDRMWSQQNLSRARNAKISNRSICIEMASVGVTASETLISLALNGKRKISDEMAIHISEAISRLVEERCVVAKTDH